MSRNIALKGLIYSAEGSMEPGTRVAGFLDGKINRCRILWAAARVWKLSLPLPFDLLLEPAAAMKSQVLRNENSPRFLRIPPDSPGFLRFISAANSIRFGIEIGVRLHKGLVQVRMNANLYSIIYISYIYRMSLACERTL